MKRFLPSVYLFPALLAASLYRRSHMSVRAKLRRAHAAKAPAAQAPARAGSIRGVVTDPSGAVIPNASLTATDATGKTYSATSDAAGAYVIRGLPTSTYSVKAGATGFATYSTNAVVVAPGSALHLDISLPIEVEQQQIEVQAESTDRRYRSGFKRQRDRDQRQGPRRAVRRSR